MSTSNLAEFYHQQVIPQLLEKLGLKNPWAVPRITKVVVNVGLGEAVTDRAVIEKTATVLLAITGQKSQTTRARLSISSFKLRKGAPIGLKVTLRGQRMFHFLEKLIKIVLPRLRDFQGVPVSGFDHHGNYNLGLREQIIFPEVDYDKVDKIRGLQITIITTAGSDEKAKLLLAALGMPFEKVKTKEKTAKK